MMLASSSTYLMGLEGRRSSELVVTTNREGCAAQLQLFQGAERCIYFGPVQRSEARRQIMSWKSQMTGRQHSECVSDGARQSGRCLMKKVRLRVSACFSLLISFLINHLRTGWLLARICSELQMTKDRKWTIDVRGCVALPGVLARLMPLTSRSD